jgi:hypothetical protein
MEETIRTELERAMAKLFLAKEWAQNDPKIHEDSTIGKAAQVYDILEALLKKGETK